MGAHPPPIPNVLSTVGSEHDSRTPMYLVLKYFGVDASTIGHGNKLGLDRVMVPGIGPPTLQLLLRSSHIRRQVQRLSVGD